MLYSAGRTFSRAQERQKRQRQRGHPQLCPSLCVVPIVAARALQAYVANARARRRSWRARGAASQSSLEAVSSARSGARLLPGRAFAVHARARTRWGCHRAMRRDVPAGAQRVLQQHPCSILAGELEHDCDSTGWCYGARRGRISGHRVTLPLQYVHTSSAGRRAVSDRGLCAAHGGSGSDSAHCCS